MKILVVGSGGREHALVWKIAQSQLVKKIYCAPGNAGISEQAECVSIQAENIQALVNFVKNNRIDLTVVGPEVPLTLGIVDEFAKEGLRIFGSDRAATRLEGSKIFAKNLMKNYKIPTAEFGVFTDMDKAMDYILEKGTPIVIKADGLAAGKGVVIANSISEARTVLEDMMIKKVFSDAGKKVVVEECLSGEEISYLCVTDGEDSLDMPPCQDHKRVFDGDRGPNTGGMGAYSPPPLAGPELINKVSKEIIIPMLDALKKEGITYKGVLYAGLMIVRGNPYVLEFNCRFGDPETQPLMMRLESDIVEIMLAVTDGNLSGKKFKWSGKPSVSVVMASGGYPGEYKKGYEITGLEDLKRTADVVAFHAGTAFRDNKVVTNGGRVLNVTAIGNTLKSAVEKAYEACSKIRWEGVHYRMDIAAKGLK